MSTQLIDALKAAVDRIAEQRKALRKAAVLLKVYPQGLVFACHTPLEDGGFRAWGHEEVPWEQLPTFDAKQAVEIVDRVCAKARAHLDPTAAPHLRVVR